MAAKKKAKKKVSKKKAIAKKAPAKLSSVLSKKVSDFILLKRSITAANKQLTEMKSEASKMELELMNKLQELNQLSVGVKVGSIKLTEKDVFNAKDWKKIDKYVFKTKDTSIYQRRLNTSLLNEMFQNGEKIAGVEHFVKHSLSVSKK